MILVVKMQMRIREAKILPMPNYWNLVISFIKVFSANFSIKYCTETRKMSELKQFQFLIIISLLSFFNANLKAQDDELDKLLKLDIEALTNISVISATKIQTKINEVPARVEIISAEDIKNNGYFTLEETLSSLPGFQFRNIVGFNSYIFQRGIPNQNNLILLLVDGIQINELNSGGFYSGGQFNLDNVDRIEVLYGPASALYGTNAVSGIINIITKDVKENNGISFSGLYGSFQSYSGNISYGFYDAEKEFGFRIASMVKGSEKADLAGAKGDFNWSDEMENFENDYSINIKTDYKSLKFGFLLQNKKSSRTTNYKSINTNYSDKNSLWNINFINSYLKYSQNINDNLDLFSTLYYRNSTVLDNTIAYTTDTSRVGYYRPNDLFGFENMLMYAPSNKLKLIGGIVFEYESLSDRFSVTESNSADKNPSIPQTPNKINNKLLSAYFQAQYKVWDKIGIYGGARFDHSTVYENVVTPRLGLVFDNDLYTIKLLYSEAFRAPKAWDYTYGKGNSDLEPEKMNSWELNFRYFILKNLTVDLSIYRNLLYDLIVTEVINNQSRAVNKGDVKTIGGDVSFHFKSKYLDTDFSYTLNSSSGIGNSGIPEISHNLFSLGMLLRPKKYLTLSLRGNFIGERDNPKIIESINSYKIENAFILYATLAYSGIDKFLISLTINNLLDEEYYHPSNRPPDRYRQPQRTILFKIGYNL